MTKKNKTRDKPGDNPLIKPPPPRWPCLDQYAAGVGPFRPRRILWSAISVLAVSPYAMGILAYYCTHHANIANLVSGGMPDLNAPFSPPPDLADVFRKAYKLVNSRKSWLVFGMPIRARDAASARTWVEYHTSNGAKLDWMQVFKDTDLDFWERWMSDNLLAMEALHVELTRLGVAEVKRISVGFDEFMQMNDADAKRAVDGAAESMRLGIT